MILAVFSTVSPYIDGMRVIPIILSPIFMLLALKAAEKSASTDLKKAKKAAVAAIVASSVAFAAARGSFVYQSNIIENISHIITRK